MLHLLISYISQKDCDTSSQAIRLLQWFWQAQFLSPLSTNVINLYPSHVALHSFKFDLIPFQLLSSHLYSPTFVQGFSVSQSRRWKDWVNRNIRSRLFSSIHVTRITSINSVIFAYKIPPHSPLSGVHSAIPIATSTIPDSFIIFPKSISKSFHLPQLSHLSK